MVHHQHRIDHCLLYPPDGPAYVGKSPRKGCRICFVVAICNQLTHMHAGLINASAWHLTPKSAKDHKGDYHELFNADNYLNWFEYSLLPNIHEPALVILDHAAYHKKKPLNTPKPSRMRKQAVLDEVNRLDINHSPTFTAAKAKIILRYLQNEHIQVQIITLAENCG